jgi:putative aldouronate transport system permease protein
MSRTAGAAKTGTVSLLSARKSFGRRVLKMRWYYLLLLPVLLNMALFHYKPMYGIVIAFKDYMILDGILGSPWVGFAHFQRLFSSMLFYRVLSNTFIISVLRIVFGFPAPILLALLLNELRGLQFKRVVQTISYLPHFISWVVLGGIIQEVLSPSRGVVNYFITLFGGKAIYFLTEPSYFRAILVSTGIWQSVGWGSIVYLAAITSIDVQQYEAAYIDGATRFQQARFITLPSLMPVVTVIFLLNLSSILNAGFDQVFNLYNGMVMSVGDIIDTYVYRVGLLGFEYSFATAVGLFKNVIGFLLVIGVNAITGRYSDYGLW